MKRDNKKIFLVLIGLPAVILAFFIGMYVGGENLPLAARQVDLPEGAEVTNKDFAPFWKAWQVLDDKFVAAASTTVEQKIWGSIQGLASSYDDPYTVFFPPQESKMFQEDISGNFEGVGMEIGIKDDMLVVVSPIKNSPADRAGVKAGDKILTIDDKSTAGMSVDEAVKLIRGKQGTVVKMNFLSDGSSRPVEKSITRAVIDIPTIETSVKPGGVFVIRLFSFTAQSPTLFRNALREFVGSGSSRLILDLRGNPGGYLDAAWDMASWFLPAGTPIVIEDFGGNDDPRIYRSKGYDIFNESLRMIILVDKGSASASEILAGALQEHGRAELVGTETFGKGSVQELVQITPETSLKVTIARWLTPKGHNLSENGLVPDYEIEPAEDDSKAVKDLQMEKALELLK